MFELTDSTLGFKLSIGVPLIVVAIGAWFISAILYQSSTPMAVDSTARALPIATMGTMFSAPNVNVFTSFLLAWLVGMVAMMFPAMVPVMSLYSGVVIKAETRPKLSRFAGPLIFLGGYLSLYLLLGVGLFTAIYAAFQLGSILPWLSPLQLAGLVVVLVFTGIWQLSSWKEKMLGKCISPMGFFMTHAKKGLSGAFRMGAEHGTYCVGCCWLYMLVMLAVAAMSMFSMVLLSGMIIVEKVFLGKTSWFKWVSAGIFFSLAALVIAFPSVLSVA